MQGRRGMVGPFSESLGFDHGSTSVDNILDSQICWNDMRNPTENRLPDLMLSSNHMNNSDMNPNDHERQNLSGWSLGQPSSSRAETEVSNDERKLEQGWPSLSSACHAVGSSLEGSQYESTDIVTLNDVNVSPQLQSSNAGEGPRNLSLCAGLAGHSVACQALEVSHLCKDGEVVHDWIPPASASDPLLLPSGSGGYFEENGGRPGCSLDNRRQSRKRKAVEGNIGQSSTDGSHSFFQCSETSSWSRIPSRYVPSSILSTSTPTEVANPRLGHGVRGFPTESVTNSAVAGRAESSHRNSRLRISPSNQESVPLLPFSTGSDVRYPSGSSSCWSLRPLHVDQPLEFRSSLAIDSPNPLIDPALNPVPALPQETQSTQWRGSTGLTIGSSSNPISLGDGVESSSRSTGVSLWENPTLVPAAELRNLVRNRANRALASINTSVPGNIASTSRSGSSTGVHPSLPRTWVPNPNPSSRNSRRLAEYVRRSLFYSSNAEPGGSSNTQSPLPAGPLGSTEETILSSGTGSQMLRRSNQRLASRMERQGDGILGIPYPLRTLPAAGEGRNRLVASEHIRNVLDLMRRGESLRFEDAMLLDQSVVFGAADIHDRHRDMRLDVDNMSYEELLALEERIGNVSTGLSEETILSRLKWQKCSIASEAEVETEPCCICQEEYKNGEDLGKLDCGHDFHGDCIKQWLMLKNWCPICKTTGLAT